jgi:cellulose biosynthesis protein BcsE
VAATCLLDLSDLQQFRALARLVYRLRRQRGRGLKILVREQGLRLRQGQANLLLALGANGILTAQTGSAALAARLEQASSEIFIRPIFDDFESAFISAMPPAVAGYQAPPRFVTLARDATRRARSGGLDCALVRFFLLPNVTPLEALQQLRILRPGDLCTADEQSVYLFLFACWQEDVDRAVENILRRPVEQLFEGQIRSVAAEAVLAELADLSVRTAQQPARNLTVALAAVPLESPASETRRVASSALRPEARKSGRRVRPAPLRLIGADS